MNRIPAPLLTAAQLLALGSLSACSGNLLGQAENGVDVVLIDRSGSIPKSDRDIYEQSIDGIGKALDVGGRVLVAEIGDKGRAGFRSLLDVKAENSDVRLKREANLRSARAKLSEALPGLLPETESSSASSTRILETIAAAAEAFKPGPDKGERLFVLSDGIEESPVVNLTRIPGSQEAIARSLEKARAEGLLPDLRGVELHLIGAGGDGVPMGAQGVRAFWQAYAEATGASLVQFGRLPYAAN